MLSRRLLFYLVLNVIVSVTSVLVTLWFWNRGTSRQIAEVAPTVVAIAPVEDNVVTVPPTLTPVAGAQDQNAQGQPVHEIASGETLGQIAASYEVAVADIVAANNMNSENDILNVGQKLLIPVATAVPEQVASLALPTSAVVELATLPPPNLDANVTIQSIVDLGIPSTEAVEIVAPSDDASPIPMGGWKIIGSNGREFTFPEYTLYASGKVKIYSGAGLNTATDLYWNQTSAIWSSGDSLNLVDPDGNTRATYTVP